MKQGEIVLVPFPFTDLSSIKSRPALVISKKNYGGDVILAGITSKKGADAVMIGNKDMVNSKLPITSYIKYRKIVTLDKSIVKKVVGKISRIKLTDVLLKLKGQF